MVAASNAADVDALVDTFRAVAVLAPDEAIQAALSMLDTVADESAKSAFVEKALEIIYNLPGEPSDVPVSARVGETSNGEKQWTEGIPADVRLHGLLARLWLLTEEGGVCSPEQLGELLGGISEEDVATRQANGELLALDLGERGLVYPVWQVREGDTLPGLDRVLAELDDFDPWMQAAFLLNPNTWLEGSSPLSELRRGKVKRAISAAARYAA